MRFFTTFVIACASLASAAVLKEDATPTPQNSAVTHARAPEAVIADLRKRQKDTFKHGSTTHTQEEHEKFCISIGNVQGCIDDTGKTEGDFEKASAALSAASQEPPPPAKGPAAKGPAAKGPAAKGPAARLI